MQERLAAETAETVEPPAAPVAHGPPVVARMLALQRSAGNRAVTRMLAREPVAEKAPDLAPTRFVFILGPKDDAALKSAEAYYTLGADDQPVHEGHHPQGHERPDARRGLRLPEHDPLPDRRDLARHPRQRRRRAVLPAQQRRTTNEKVTTEELDQALHDGVLRPLDDGQITAKTRIRLQACFAGHAATMVNLLDRAFGEGAGTVIAPTEEVAYSNDIWHSEGISGWWVWAPEKLSPEALSTALQAKYGKSVKLDLSSYLEDTGEHHKGEAMKTEDEMWLELSRKATITEHKGDDGKTLFLHVANIYTQKNRPEYEDDPVLYTKSTYYSPKEI